MTVFIPRKYKFRKVHKSVRIKKNEESKINILNSSVCGLKILRSGLISSTVLEACRRSIRRKTKKLGTLKINGFPFIPVTAKATGLRMGKGVGNIESWVFPIKEGRILFELNNIPLDLGKIALKAAASKLNLPSKIVSNYNIK